MCKTRNFKTTLSSKFLISLLGLIGINQKKEKTIFVLNKVFINSMFIKQNSYLCIDHFLGYLSFLKSLIY